jgi:hypothetical protein
LQESETENREIADVLNARLEVSERELARAQKNLTDARAQMELDARDLIGLRAQVRQLEIDKLSLKEKVSTTSLFGHSFFADLFFHAA